MDGQRSGGARNEDDAIGHWLGLLRDGGPEDQATARTELGLILERRGMLDDAIEAYERNVADGVRDRRPYDRLVAIYRERGDAAAEASVTDAFAAVLRGTDTPTMVGLPRLSPTTPAPAASPASDGLPDDLTSDDRGYDDPEYDDAAPEAPRAGAARRRLDAPRPLATGPVEPNPRAPEPPATRSPDALPPAPVPAPDGARPYAPPPDQSVPGARPRQRPIGRPIASSGRQGSGISPGLGILIALIGLLVLIGSIVFATLWSGGRLGPINLGASLGQVGGQADAVSEPGSPTTPSAAAGATPALAVAPAASPTPAPPGPECWNPSVRFPDSEQPEAAVRRALLDHLGRQEVAVDQDTPRVRSLLDAHVARADDLVAGWIGVSLQRAQRRLQTFSLAAYVGSELLLPNEVGQYALRSTISEQGWREMQAWPAETCEGAFMTRSENARWVGAMRASVGDISWAQATSSPAASPSPSPAAR